MSAPDLPNHLIEAGKRILVALDSVGLGAQGAGWVYDHALIEWRFIVVTSLVETMGRSRVYKRLLDVMEKLDIPRDLTIDAIHMLSTADGFYMGIARALKVTGSSTVRIHNCVINGRKLDAVLYRWGDQPPTAVEQKKVHQRFEKRIRELAR